MAHERPCGAWSPQPTALSEADDMTFRHFFRPVKSYLLPISTLPTSAVRSGESWTISVHTHTPRSVTISLRAHRHTPDAFSLTRGPPRPRVVAHRLRRVRAACRRHTRAEPHLYDGGRYNAGWYHALTCGSVRCGSKRAYLPGSHTNTHTHTHTHRQTHTHTHTHTLTRCPPSPPPRSHLPALLLRG